MKDIVFLSFDEVIYCLIIAFFLTIIIKAFIFFKSIDIELEYPLKNSKDFLENAYKFFPKETIKFRGKIYERGTNIKILLNSSKVYEGEFIGVNSNGVLCLITKDFITTIRIKNISDIKLVN